MRTLVDIPDRQIVELASVCEIEKLPRSEVIRRAIALYIETKKPASVNAFGIWKERGEDGLAYQERVRSEW